MPREAEARERGRQAGRQEGSRGPSSQNASEFGTSSKGREERPESDS